MKKAREAVARKAQEDEMRTKEEDMKKELNFKRLIEENEAKAAALEAGTATLNDVVAIEHGSPEETENLLKSTRGLVHGSHVHHPLE